MSDRVNGDAGAGMDPWRPIKREPLKPKTEASEAKSAGKTVPIGLALTIPEDAVAALKDLAETQKALTEAFTAAGERMDAAAQQGAQVMSAIGALAKSHEAMTQAGHQHSSAIAQALTKLEALAKSIERAAMMPKKVTLQRDKDGVAVAAVSKPMKEGAA